MIFDQVVDLIEKGKEGRNIGLPFGNHERLLQYIPNIQKGTYYLLGALSGCGKTSYVDETFVFVPFEYVINNPNVKLDIIYYSYEIEKRIKIAKAVCRHIFYKHKIIVDVNYILSRGKNRISTEIFNMVVETRDHFSKLEDILHIKDIPIHPTGVNADLAKFYEKQGKISGEGPTRTYTPHHPNHYVIVVIDHIALSKREQGFSTKENIDKLSEYMVYNRNLYGTTPVLISQFNRDISGTDRVKVNRLLPQNSDFKDSGNPFQDSNIVLALFAPHRMDIPTFDGHKVNILQDRYRALSILKNRDGDTDVIMSMKYIGEVGTFKELPNSSEIDENGYKQIINGINARKYRDSSL